MGAGGIFGLVLGAVLMQYGPSLTESGEQNLSIMSEAKAQTTVSRAHYNHCIARDIQKERPYTTCPRGYPEMVGIGRNNNNSGKIGKVNDIVCCQH